MLKHWFRRPGVQNAVAFVLWLYVRFALSTIRWRFEGLERIAPLWDAPPEKREGVIVCFWHSVLMLSPASWPLGRAQPPKAMISLSPDGEFLAKLVERLGFPGIRGSARKESDPTNDKGGNAAFKEALRWVKGGNAVAITPDGPRGPAEVMKDGAAVLARSSGAPVMLVGLACRPALRLKSWDHACIPLPFARGAMVWAGGERAERRADTAALSSRWAAELSAATRRAEALVA